MQLKQAATVRFVSTDSLSQAWPGAHHTSVDIPPPRMRKGSCCGSHSLHTSACQHHSRTRDAKANVAAAKWSAHARGLRSGPQRHAQ